MKEYTIAAIPTIYRGRQYRSRLEARWAAFFDKLGWRHEYEPFDLGAWSPDFLLSDTNTLVEVKPWTAFDNATWVKAAEAMMEQGRPETLLLLPVAPISFREVYQLGWLGFPQDRFLVRYEAWLFYLRNAVEPDLWADLLTVKDGGTPDDPTFRFADGVELERSAAPDRFAYHDHVRQLWAHASNEVQWHAKGDTP